MFKLKASPKCLNCIISDGPFSYNMFDSFYQIFAFPKLVFEWAELAVVSGLRSTINDFVIFLKHI